MEEIANKKGAFVRVAVVLFLAVIIIGYGIYSYMDGKASNERDNLNRQIAEMQKQISDMKAANVQNNETKGSDTSDNEAYDNVNNKADDKTAGWKTYSNNRYGYTIKYPGNWYADVQYSENDFTKRGGEDVGIVYVGGDIAWSNYPKFDYDLGSAPDDLKTISLMIDKTDQSLNDFSKSYGVSEDAVSGKTLGKIQGKDTLSFVSDYEDRKTASVFVKLSDNSIMAFSTSEENKNIMDSMISSLKFTR